jgi:hypothetical protein
LAIGDFEEWKIDHVNGGTDWKMRVKCVGYTTFQLLATWSGSTYSLGTPFAETWRFGGVQTGMSDHHHNLQYRNTADIWVSWANMGVQCDSATDWDGKKIAADHYDTVGGTFVNC